MLPKNELTRGMMARLFVFKDTYHDFQLPQFLPQLLPDPNKIMGFDAIKPDSKIIFHSAKEVPAEFKDMKVELDPHITNPESCYEVTAGRGKKYIFANAQLETWAHRVKRYKTTRPI